MKENLNDFLWNIYEDGYNGSNLVINTNILTQGKDKVYCHESYAQELYNMFINPKHSYFISKDLMNGDIMLVKEFNHMHKYDVMVTLVNGITFTIDLNKEEKFINLYGYKTPEEFLEVIKVAPDLGGECYACCVDNKSGRYSLWEGHIVSLKKEFEEQIQNPTIAYNAKIKDINGGGFFVDIQGVEAYLPGSLAAANIVSDFNAMVGQNIIVMIENYVPKMNSYIVSHKKYIKYSLKNRIKELEVGKIYKGKITGTNLKIGIFVEIDNFFTVLIHSSKMSQQMLSKFTKNLYKAGEDIDVIIDQIEEKTNKIILRDPLYIEDDKTNKKDNQDLKIK